MSARRKTISYQDYVSREARQPHAPLTAEINFLNLIKTGDVRRVRALCKEPFHEKEGLGILSDDPMRNIRYHFVITAAIIARNCIEGGMSMPESYGMSDYYIRLADDAGTFEEITEIHEDMCVAYARRMREVSKEDIFSRHVAECIDYIYEHLDEKIRMEDLTRASGLSEGYLSRLFKTETNMTVTEYITAKKIETARNMLANSDYPIVWISDALAFPSQSYFTRVFTKRCKVTPARYRKISRR
ncbi:MAG: helix-turn-helix domain-containing protein [Clostridiales bacterium]|nr:helix-turn-helix domain-containing protein [Clostridiales bacterium]